MTAPRTYRLHIHLPRAQTLIIGALGEWSFPAGDYIYTGSAKKNFEARIARHLRRDKRLRWHIDYLLAASGARVVRVDCGIRPECEWNQATPGRVLVPRFGASDCRAGCGAHLKYLS